MVKIVCPLCARLVEVVNRVVEVHADCMFGGSRYVAQKFRTGGPSSPSIEVLGMKEISCPEHGDELAALVRISSPDPSNN